jgi:hypothetical protein
MASVDYGSIRGKQLGEKELERMLSELENDSSD